MVIVVVEHRQQQVNRASVEAVVAAQQLGEPVVAVLIGHGVAPLAAALQPLDLAGIVLLDHEALGDYTSDGFVEALASFIPSQSASHVVFAHTYQARDFVPRLAARLDRPLVADCIGITRGSDEFRFRRPVFQGKLHADVVLEGPGPHLLSVQVGAFRADEARLSAAAVPVSSPQVDLALDRIRQRPEPPFREAQQAVDLAQAERIVAVGRGIKDASKIELIRELATALGAELAASRPICDAGWLPMDRQVGSSGQTVAPKLYVAIGISGAIQHVVGMKGSRTIVAVNTDAEAPIFEVATLGITGDLFEVVPAIIAALLAA